MTSNEAAQALIADLAPKLSELGFESFVLAAYHRHHDETGKEIIERQVIVNGGSNVPMQDGLRSMVIMAQRWNAGQL